MSDQLFAEYLPPVRRRWQQVQADWQTRRGRVWEAAGGAAMIPHYRVYSARIAAELVEIRRAGED